MRRVGAGIVTSGEPRELAAEINALHRDADRRLEMGTRGKRAVHDELSWAAVAAQMEAVYRKVITGTPVLRTASHHA